MYSELKELGRLRTKQAQDQAERELGFEAATQKRTDEANQRRVLAQTPAANFDLPQAYQFGAQNAAAPTTVVGNPTGGGSAYVARPQGKVSDKTVLGDDSSTAELRRLAGYTGGPGTIGMTSPLSSGDLYKAAISRMKAAKAAGQKFDPRDVEITSRGPSGGIQPPNPSFATERFQELMRLNRPTPAAATTSQATGATPKAGVNAPQRQTAGGDFEAFKNAIFGQESSNGAVDTSRPNYAGALGKGQILESTFEGLKRQGKIPANYQWTNPQHNEQAAVAYMQEAWQAAGGDPAKAAAYYYGGPKAIAGGQINTFGDRQNPNAPTTNQYAEQVLRRMGRAVESVIPAAQAAPQQAPEPTFSGMGPAGTPQMLQEQIELGKFQYQQLNQLLQHSSPEQQAKLVPQRDALVADIRAKQAYMLAAQSDANPQALGQLVAMAGAQAARTQDGRFVLVDAEGKPVVQPMTGGQLGAYLFRAMDARAQAAQAEMRGKIALAEAEARAKAEGELAVQGMTTAELKRLEALLKFYDEQNKPGETKAIADPMKGGITFYNSRQPGPTPEPNTVLPQ